MTAASINTLLESAEKGVTAYLTSALQEGRIDEQSYDLAVRNTFSSIKSWLKNRDLRRISPKLVEGLAETIRQERWEDLVNAFRQQARFGTGGIRGMMAFDRDSIVRLQTEGIDAPILKGPNTINDVVLLLTSAGVARFGKGQSPPFEKVVIGYDSRVRGYDFAAIVAELFLAYDYTVYFFDEPCPYPEMTFAIPYQGIKADIGILISASHNDYRYNGYKLSCAQRLAVRSEQHERDVQQVHRQGKTSATSSLCPFADARQTDSFSSAATSAMPGFDYCGREDRMHQHPRAARRPREDVPDDGPGGPATSGGRTAAHRLLRLPRRRAAAVPRLLKDVGFADVKVITHGRPERSQRSVPFVLQRPRPRAAARPGRPRAARRRSRPSRPSTASSTTSTS